ncbi:hypothetical protein, partial [Anaerotruncus colihominis]|uniref:hypothetical protein n=1 Tax=Anaerotruncus colihominis TaxID=169435 RepID=UPI002108755D
QNGRPYSWAAVSLFVLAWPEGHATEQRKGKEERYEKEYINPLREELFDLPESGRCSVHPRRLCCLVCSEYTEQLWMGF